MKHAIFVLVTFLFFACSNSSDYPGFTITSSGLLFKRITIGEGQIYPQQNFYVSINCQLKSKTGQIIDDENLNILHGYNTFQIKGSGFFEGGIYLLNAGDSACFIIPYSNLVESVKRNFKYKEEEQYISSPDSIIVALKLVEVFSEDEYNNNVIALEKWSNSEDEFEQKLIEEYLVNNGIENKPSSDGLFFIPVKEGKGNNASFGNALLIDYVGTYLNGNEFDNTYKTKEPLDFILGQSDQVIKGIELGILKMKRGGKAKIILPSHLAWGKYGSSNGKIPPNTPVIFDIEIQLIN